MEGTVRVLLLMTLAIAVSARYEFDRRAVEIIEEGIGELDPSGKIAHTNMDGEVEWKASRDDDELEIVFDIISPVPYGEDCGGGPAITIDEGPMHCLYSVSFFADTDDNKNDILTLGLHFRHNTMVQNERLVLLDVFAPPVNQGDDVGKILQLQPFNINQLERAQRGHSFSAPVSWVGNILDKEVYAAKSTRDANEESQGDTEDTMDMIYYTGHPVIIEGNIVEAIVDLETPDSPK